jgi:Ran GTPase-activating protein (RanGAP) involved in mRNA processing and transport
MSKFNLKLELSTISLPTILKCNDDKFENLSEAKSLFLEDYLKLKKYLRSNDDDENEIEDFEFTEKCMTEKERLLSLYQRACDAITSSPKSGFINCIMSNDLNLSYLFINDFDLMAISVALQKRLTLEQLNLSSNFITSSGLNYVSSMLLHCSNLKVLDLSNNKLDKLDNLIRQVNKKSFNDSLIVVSLSNNYINDDQAENLGKLLKKNQQMITLLLDGNKISKKTCDMLGECIANNNNLSYLDLKSNLISGNCIGKLMLSLKKNVILTHLNLSYNNLSSEGTLLLAKAFIGSNRNQTLTHLDLTANNIEEPAAITLSRCLKQAQQLVHLKIGLNPVGRLGSYAILKAFTDQQSKLEFLDLKGVIVNNDFVKLLNYYNKTYHEIKCNYEAIYNHITLKPGEPYTIIDDFDLQLLDDKSIRKCLLRDPFKFLLKYIREFHPEIVAEFKKHDQKEEFKIYMEHFMDCLKKCTSLNKNCLNIIYAHLKKAKDSAGQIFYLPFIMPNTLTNEEVRILEREKNKLKQLKPYGSLKK